MPFLFFLHVWRQCTCTCSVSQSSRFDIYISVCCHVFSSNAAPTSSYPCQTSAHCTPPKFSSITQRFIQSHSNSMKSSKRLVLLQKKLRSKIFLLKGAVTLFSRHVRFLNCLQKTGVYNFAEVQNGFTAWSFPSSIEV